LIKSLEDILFNACKNKVGFYRSEYFKIWFHKEYPDMIQHHLLGSYTSIKTSDYCSIPVTHQQHQIAESDKSQFAIDNLPLMLQAMIKYIIHLENKIKELESETIQTN